MSQPDQLYEYTVVFQAKVRARSEEEALEKADEVDLEHHDTICDGRA